MHGACIRSRKSAARLPRLDRGVGRQQSPDVEGQIVANGEQRDQLDRNKQRVGIDHVGLGSDYTIYSLIDGVVKFEHKDRSRYRISVYPFATEESAPAA